MADSATAAKKSAKLFIVTVASMGLLLGAAAFWGANKSIIGLFHDDGIYAVVGKSVAEGQGYRIISLPQAPPETKYPFLYAYLLSWLWALNPSFPQNIALLKALNVAILPGIFFAAVLYYRRYNRPSTAAAILFGLVACTNPIIFGFTDYILSDLLLVLFTMIALSMCAGVNSENGSFAHLILLAVIVGLACLTRSAALPLVFAGAVHAFVLRGWRASGWFLLVVLLVTAPWLVWLSFHPRPAAESLLAYYTSYDKTGAPVDNLSAWLISRSSILAGNTHYLLDMFQLFYLVTLLPGSVWLIGCFSVLGLIAFPVRDEPFMWSLVICSLILLLIWPFHPGRYLAPLAPLVVMFLFRGMSWTQAWVTDRLADSWAPQGLAKLAWCPVLIVLLLNGVWLSSYLLNRDERTTRGLYGRHVPYGWSGFEETFAWVQGHAAPDAVLATAYDPMYFLYSGRRAIRPALHRPASYFYPYGEARPDVGSVAEVKPQLAQLGVDYLIIDPMDGYAEGPATIKLLEDLVLTFGRQAKMVFTSADGKHRIYRIAN